MSLSTKRCARCEQVRECAGDGFILALKPMGRESQQSPQTSIIVALPNGPPKIRINALLVVDFIPIV